MKKPFYILSWVAIACSIGLVLLITYWLAWPYKIATQNGPAKILTPVVKNGEEVRYTLDFCKYREIVPTSVTRQLVDGVIYTLPAPNSSRVLSLGCKVVESSTPIILPGCAECYNRDVYLELISTYQVNPLRRVTVKFTTEKFKVVK